MPKAIPKNKRMGRTSHPKNTTIPKQIINISAISPKAIRKLLTNAPKSLESMFERKASIYLLMLNPLP
jgi:hypothetical protein